MKSNKKQKELEERLAYLIDKPFLTSVSAYYCDSNNKRNANRKPNTGMIKQYMDFVEYMNDDEDEEEKIVYDTILMIGDASGKEGQFSDSDKKTAENFGCEYMDVNDFVYKYNNRQQK